MDVDIRSESCAELEKVDAAFLGIVKSAGRRREPRAVDARGQIEADPKVIGERPCGETSMEAPILKTTAAVVQAFGLKPSYSISSTDSNIPMSMGIPALTIGRGGPGGRAIHRTSGRTSRPAASRIRGGGAGDHPGGRRLVQPRRAVASDDALTGSRRSGALGRHPGDSLAGELHRRSGAARRTKIFVGS